MSSDYKPDAYWRSKDFKSSARLYLQHWLFQSTVGHVIDPLVSSSLQAKGDEPIRVADLACGNGAWLVEASKVLPKSAALQGFDIQPRQFPAAAYLPPNITLDVRDVLTAIPSDLNGVFDVVHVRAFGSLINDNDTTPLLETARKLLKPGGFLQWEESPQDTMTAQAPSEDIPRASTQAILHILAEGAKSTGHPIDWYQQLSKQAQQVGFDSVQLKDFALKPEHFKAWTENYLLVWEDVALLLPSKADAPDAPLNREQYQHLFEKAVEESNQGVVAHSQKLIGLVARKPL